VHFDLIDYYICNSFGAFTVSVLVNIDIILMPFLLQFYLKVASMQVSGFLTSKSSNTIFAFSRSLSRLVTYFLMRLSLGLGK